VRLFAVDHRLKRFEDQEVSGSRLIIPRTVVDIAMDMTVDEKVTISFTAIVVGASFDVNKKTGELIRTHKINIIDTEVEPL
jgi:hypothetical protein